jgi:hypothetical protein
MNHAADFRSKEGINFVDSSKRIHKYTASSALSVKSAGENTHNIREIRTICGNFFNPKPKVRRIKKPKD